MDKSQSSNKYTLKGLNQTSRPGKLSPYHVLETALILFLPSLNQKIAK